MSTALKTPVDAGMQAPYYDRGHYLFRITTSKLNKRGEPFISLNVLRSHDNRRVNSYYPMNFFIKSDSTKQKALWDQKLKELLRATDIDRLTDMNQLDGLTVTVYFSRSGYSPLPSFSAPKLYSDKYGDAVTEIPKTKPDTHNSDQVHYEGMNIDPDDNWDAPF